MAKPLEQLSFDAQRAAEQFSSAFQAAFESVLPEQEWARAFGTVEDSDQLLLTYPMSISAAGYNERTGDDQARDMYSRSISVTPVEWTDGVKVQKRRLEQNDFAVQAWTKEAAQMAVEARRHANTLVARMLHANANIQLYKDSTLGTDLGIPLFSNAHRVNIFDADKGTFKNVLLGGGTDFAGNSIDTAMAVAVLNHGRTGIKAANGTPKPIRYTDMIVHPAKEQLAKQFLESDLMRAVHLEGGVGSQKNTNFNSNNIYKRFINLVVADELAGVSGVDEDKVYFVDRNSYAKPWVIQTGKQEEVFFGPNSEYCMETGLIKVNVNMLMAATAALPHAILRVDLSP